MIATLLIFHIMDIVSLCSGKQMFGIYTTGDITSMQNILTFWYYSNIKFIRKPMRQNTTAANPYRPIAASIYSGFP